MINQIEIASEQKDSNLASTLAHETRKNNAGRILFLSLCVVVALAGAAMMTSCNGEDDNEDETIATSVVTSINAEVTGLNPSVTAVKVGFKSEGEGGETIFRTIGEGTFSNGRININLSQTGAPQVRRWYNFDDDDAITSSNPNARVTMYEGIIGYDANGKILGWFEYQHIARQSYGYLTYSDSDVTVTGASLSNTTWRVSLKTGWNIVYVTRFGPTWEFATSDPGDLSWYWKDEPEGNNDNGNSGDIVGKWQIIETTFSNSNHGFDVCELDGSWFEIKNNGTFEDFNFCENLTTLGTWNLEDKSLTLVLNGSSSVYTVVSVSENELILSIVIGGVTVTVKSERL